MAVIFNIVFSLFDEGITREVCGFEMGYISFIYGDNNDIYDDLSHQPFMIFLTISELILGLVEYEGKKLSSKEVIAVDSSYSLKFVRNNKMTDLVVNNDFTITVDTGIMLKEICYSSIEFCKMYDSSLLTSIKSDLDYAFDKAGKMIESAANNIK